MKKTYENLEYSPDSYLTYGGEIEIQDVAHTTSRDPANLGPENCSDFPRISLAVGRAARYSINSKPAGPLPQGTHTSAGVSLRGGW